MQSTLGLGEMERTLARLFERGLVDWPGNVPVAGP